MGNRGVSPTLFPEVFNEDGSVNYPLAMKLYGSKEQIDDIEAVRQDMQNKGLLPEDGKIMIYGGSGGGVLVQQYLDKYGDHVSRALIESSGGPDLARVHNVTFIKNTYDYFPLIHWLLDAPAELEVKVRIYELMGEDLENYHPDSARDICLGYEWSRVLLADFIKAQDGGKIQITQISPSRSRYRGEVMVWSRTADQDFSNQMGHWVSDSYPHSRLAVFDDAHRRQKYPDYYREFRKAFFTAGLNSSEVQVYFNDPRQLNAESDRQ